MTPLLELGSAFRDLDVARASQPLQAGVLIAATGLATALSAALPSTSVPATAASSAADVAGFGRSIRTCLAERQRDRIAASARLPVTIAFEHVVRIDARPNGVRDVRYAFSTQGSPLAPPVYAESTARFDRGRSAYVFEDSYLALSDAAAPGDRAGVLFTLTGCPDVPDPSIGVTR